MNKPIDPRSLEPFKVTTGPLPASQKLYSPAPGFPEVRVPYREIALHPSAKEEPVRVYDTTGPYTDPDIRIDVHEGLPPVRSAWIAARADAEAYEGRRVKPEDNGNVSIEKLVTEFPNKRQPLRARGNPSPLWGGAGVGGGSTFGDAGSNNQSHRGAAPHAPTPSPQGGGAER